MNFENPSLTKLVHLHQIGRAAASERHPHGYHYDITLAKTVLKKRLFHQINLLVRVVHGTYRQRPDPPV